MSRARERVERGSGAAGVAPPYGLPPPESPCVWATAGVLAYRPCDRGYDCEECPLDAALSGRTGAGPRSTATPEPARSTGELRADLLYHPAHVWVRPEGPGRVRVGVDALVARLLDRVRAVVLPRASERIEGGRPTCWLVDEDRPLPLPAPVSGTVLAVNTAVQQDPGLVRREPYEGGWLLEAACEQDPGEDPGLMSAAAMRRHTARQLDAIRSRARAPESRDRLGTTLPDGGELPTDLRESVGTPGLQRLVLELLR